MSTRDLALAGIEQAINTVIGLDPSGGMLDVGRQKIEKGRLEKVEEALKAKGITFIYLEDVREKITVLDKLRGLALQSGLETRGHVLLSTGRVSSEMLNKARRMETPIVCSPPWLKTVTLPDSSPEGMAPAAASPAAARPRFRHRPGTAAAGS